jgi:hypothetical protein
MSVQVKRRREAASFLATYTGAAGELLVDTTNNRVQVHDGSTPGGFPAAKLSEVPVISPLVTLAQGAHGSNIQFGCLEELETMSGASVTSGIQIPSRAVVFAVSCLVLTAITGATSFEVGVSSNLSQFGSGLGISAGSNNSGIIGPTGFYAATPIILTSAGGSFTGGTVRISIQYMLCGVPTS